MIDTCVQFFFFKSTKSTEYLRTLFCFVQEALRQYPVLMWIDASVRMKTGNMTSVFNHVMRSGGVLLYGYTIFANIQATAPELYEYFPSDQARQLKTTHSPSGAMFFVLTRYNFENIIYWFVLWALEHPGDMKPARSICNVTIKDRSSCRRFDQACINILLSNLHSFNQSVYSLANSRVPLTYRRDDVRMASEFSRILMGTATNDTRASVAQN